MDRMNKLADDVEQAAANELGAKQPSSELRTLNELELMLAGGGDHTVEWP